MRQNSLLIKVGATLSAIAAATTMALFATAVPAAAGTCDEPYCGGSVTNLASSSIAVTNCWDGGIGAGIIYREKLQCATNGWTTSRPNAHMSVGPRGDSVHPHYYDVDGFRVYRGCRVIASYNGGREQTFDRRGSSSSMWVRMTGRDMVAIHSISC